MKFKVALSIVASLLLASLFASPNFVAQAVDIVPGGFSESLVAQGFKTPTNMAIAPDGRIFILEQQMVSVPGGQEGRGYVRVVKNGTLLPTPFATITDLDLTNEHGLLGIAFDPKFLTNGYLYLFYTKPDGGGFALHNEVWRYTASPPSSDVVLANSGKKVIQFPGLDHTVHAGGSMHFSPIDGKLYIGIGDDQTGDNEAQNINDFRGRFMRYTINADGTFSAPTDNPWYSTANNAISKGTWAMGFRNPYQFGIQPGTGRIFANEVGQDTTEEIDLVQRGKHYGWKFCEGPCSPANPLYTNPVYYYAHSGSADNSGCAITGGTFYNPTNSTFPASYTGKYFFNDYCNNWIRYVDPANPSQSTLFATNIYPFTVALAVSANGSLYYLARGNSASDGRLLRIDYTPGTAPTINDPPVSKTIAAGTKATFTCSGSGTGPITYQWQRQNPGATTYVDLSGATATSYTTPVTSVAADNGARYRCKATNIYGSTFSPYAMLSVVVNQPPTISINVKINGSAARQTWLLGDTISFTITATDAIDGTLPNSSLTFSVDLYHEPPLSGIHVHPILPVTTDANSGEFSIETTAHDLAHLYYRINVRATDSGGLFTDTYKNIESSLLSPIYNSTITSVNPVLRWQPIPGAVSYEVYFGLTNMPTTHYSVPANISYLVLPQTLIPTQTYYWMVKVLYSGGASTGTDTWRFHVDSPTTGAPVRNYFTNSKPTFTWNRITFATGYHIQIATSSTFTATTIVYDTTVSGNTTLSHHITTALAEGVYYWRVAPLRADGTTGYFGPGQIFTVRLS